MHSRDPNKNKAAFRQEILAILNGVSERCFKDRHDFTWFIFPEANFYRATFTQKADFRGATFTEEADFRSATFTQKADFVGATFTRDASFRGATFTQKAYFDLAKFTQTGVFSDATFAHDTYFAWVTFACGADFSTATFSRRVGFYGTRFGLPHYGVATVAAGGGNPTPAIANFMGAQFEQPARVRFYQVNRGTSHGLRAHFVDCDISDIQFVDVYWHQHEGRMALEDELVLYSEYRAQPESDYELVATAYRQMVNNFEKARNYGLAEDCYIGAMEMKRLDPAEPPTSRIIVTVYRWLSGYGSSYTRALGMLSGFLLAFALLFPVFGLRMTDPQEAERVQCPVAAPGSPESSVISWGCAMAHAEVGREAWGSFKAGLLAAAETATFQRRPTLEPANNWGRAVAMTEVVVIPGQLALLFLALRRRFRR